MDALLETLGLTETIENKMYAEAAVEWLKKHTVYQDFGNPSVLPSSVKLFIYQYPQLVINAGVASESITGMSQSFVTGQALESQIYQLAIALLGIDSIQSTVTVHSGEDRWDYEGKI